MSRRLDDLPIYEQQITEVDAALYNRVQLLKSRRKLPIRFPLEGLRDISLILEYENWIVVDESMGDLPVMAWLDFDIKRRDNLHMPIKCKFNSYHAHAEKIVDQVLKRMTEHLSLMLSNNDPAN